MQRNAEQLYYEGMLSKSQNPELAFKQFYEASELGHLQSTTQLAFCYLNGEGVTQDKKKAYELFLQAGELGEGGAQFNLGQMLENGDGVKQDLFQARDWYQKAYENKIEDANYMLDNVEHRIDILNQIKNTRHRSIVHIMKALGCRLTSDGACHGISHMGMSAFLSGDNELNVFNERIAFMMNEAGNAIWEEEMREESEKISIPKDDEKYYMAVYKKYFAKEFDKWYEAAESKLGFNNLFLTLSAEERKKWDLLKSVDVFAQDIDLYFNPARFVEDELKAGLFEEGQSVRGQDAKIVMPLLHPLTLDKQGGMNLVKVDDKSCEKCC